MINYNINFLLKKNAKGYTKTNYCLPNFTLTSQKKRGGAMLGWSFLTLKMILALAFSSFSRTPMSSVSIEQMVSRSTQQYQLCTPQISTSYYSNSKGLVPK